MANLLTNYSFIQITSISLVLLMWYSNIAYIQVGLMRSGVLLAESPPDALIQSYSMTVSEDGCVGVH